MLLGSRKPQYHHVPDGDTTYGDKAVAFARAVGLTLFPWQEDVLRDMCRTRKKTYINPQGEEVTSTVFSAREAVISIARQNGKGEILIARELAGIYLFGEQTILHTAHQSQTSNDAMKRLWHVISNNDTLMHWWDDEHGSATPVFSRSHGKEEIRFPTGQLISFKPRSSGKIGRGLTVDLTIIDECYDLPADVYAGISSLSTAVESAQTIFISSPVDRYTHMHGGVFSSKRWQGMDGDDNTYYAEWCAGESDDPFSITAWKNGNPSLVEGGPGAQLDDIKQKAAAAKNNSSLLDTFMVESLGVGNWEPRDSDADTTLAFSDDDISTMLVDYKVDIDTPVLTLETTPDRETVSITVSGKNGAAYHNALIYNEPYDMTATLQVLRQLINKIDPYSVVVDGKAKATTAIIKTLENNGFDINALSYSDFVAANENFLQLVGEHRVTVFDDDRGVVSTAVKTITLRDKKNSRDAPNLFERYSGEVSSIVAMAMGTYVVSTMDVGQAKEKPTKPKAKSRVVSNRKKSIGWG